VGDAYVFGGDDVDAFVDGVGGAGSSSAGGVAALFDAVAAGELRIGGYGRARRRKNDFQQRSQ